MKSTPRKGPCFSSSQPGVHRYTSTTNCFLTGLLHAPIFLIAYFSPRKSPTPESEKPSWCVPKERSPDLFRSSTAGPRRGQPLRFKREHISSVPPTRVWSSRDPVISCVSYDCSLCSFTRRSSLVVSSSATSCLIRQCPFRRRILRVSPGC